MNITWLLKQLDNNNNLSIRINREHEKCKTPKRNNEVSESLEFFISLHRWCKNIKNAILKIHYNCNISNINGSDIFIPVVPLFDLTSNDTDYEMSSFSTHQIVKILSSVESKRSKVLLSDIDIDSLLTEQVRTLYSSIDTINSLYSELSPIARIVLCFSHIMDICSNFIVSIDYTEEIIRIQLIEAIGKEITPSDFTEYLQYHFRNLFKEEYEPKLFLYSIRGPNHCPEGKISIEYTPSDQESQPIDTFSRKLENAKDIRFSINSATKIQIGGDRYIHAWLNSQFSNSNSNPINIVARANQFSSFILLLGNVLPENEFQPKHGIIVQNKDEFLIPLLTEVLPTPKEFKKAIESLSKEQRAFAKAYRSMQLENTLFGLCIIQIKPHLEQLLNLPENSLTKEIKLTQNLIKLFVEYQIPSDLLAYQYEEGIIHSDEERVNYVKYQVENIENMILEIKEEELKLLEQIVQINQELFIKQEIIGRNEFGKIYKGIYNGDKVMALNVFDSLEIHEIEEKQEEIKLMQNFKCDNLARNYGSFIENEKLCIPMEYFAGGSVLDLVS